MELKDLRIGAPVTEDKLPPSLKEPHSKYLELFARVLKLKKNELLPVTCKDEETAKKLYHAVSNTNFAEFRCFQRGNVLYVRAWNEKDDAEKKHRDELRELAKQKKEQHGATNSSH